MNPIYTIEHMVQNSLMGYSINIPKQLELRMFHSLYIHTNHFYRTFIKVSFNEHKTRPIFGHKFLQNSNPFTFHNDTTLVSIAFPEHHTVCLDEYGVGSLSKIKMCKIPQQKVAMKMKIWIFS